MTMYACVGSNRLDEALAFYTELLALRGMKKMFDNSGGGSFFGNAAGDLFAVVTPFDGEPASAGNGTMTGFPMDSRDAVDALYAKALALGGTDEGPPGLRGPEEVGAYFAYFRDLDGNKLCAFHWVLG
tara:strand:+ start:12515 stop:12898 length:384 start_codon:yes stop_codon:yes gene_type:complete